MPSSQTILRGSPFGAELADSGVRFRVWAPERKAVQVVLVDTNGTGVQTHSLERESGEFFSGDVSDAAEGSFYYFQLDEDPKQYPDPASRFQPHGVHGPSQVIDPGQFEWKDDAWPGVRLKGQVIYELHVGTFTPQGTWAAAAEKLPHLADLGITLIEAMPVAAFPGKFGWGYDGTYWFAPTELY